MQLFTDPLELLCVKYKDIAKSFTVDFNGFAIEMNLQLFFFRNSL